MSRAVITLTLVWAQAKTTNRAGARLTTMLARALWCLAGVDAPPSVPLTDHRRNARPGSPGRLEGFLFEDQSPSEREGVIEA